MIETPLVGRFDDEDRRLAFGPPFPYYHIVTTTLVAGLVSIVIGLSGQEIGPGAWWWRGLGIALLAAWAIAWLFLPSVVFSERDRTYRRREGAGGIARRTHGEWRALDAVVLIAEPNGRFTGGVTYHLVLHWKGHAEPPLVLGYDTRVLVPGAPLASAAGPLRERGRRYAEFLGVTFYDNAHFPGRNPQALLRP